MRIAITGGIGSGKSQVLSMLKEWGACVIDADEVNRRLLSQTGYLARLKQEFPFCFFKNDLDKGALKKLVFEKECERNKLNALAHPYIMDEIERFAFHCEKENKHSFAEIPLLNEKHAAFFNRIWLVETPKELRKERVLKRDNMDETLFERITESQKNLFGNFERCDVIDNSSTYAMLEQKVRKLYCALPKP